MIGDRRIQVDESTTMKRFLLPLLLLATSSGWAVSIYSSGDFKDPSPSTDTGHRWAGGFDFSAAEVLAESFALSSSATLNGVNLWTYDSTDGSSGTLTQVKYAIYAGGTQPGGMPVDSGFGTVTSSVVLPGHRIGDFVGSDGHLHEGLQTIATSFNLVRPVSLSAGTTYWLAVSALTNPFGVNNWAAWADANTTGGTFLARIGDAWSTVAGDRAFVLQGSLAGAAVPEASATLPLLGLGFAALILFGQRIEKPRFSGGVKQQ